MRDILVRLRPDAGQLTIAELIQEREAAACEIERLRNQQSRAVAVAIPARGMREALPPPTPAKVVPSARPAVELGAPVRPRGVCKLVSLSRSSIYLRVAEGSFPAPLKLSDHCGRWRREDLETWIRSPDLRCRPDLRRDSFVVDPPHAGLIFWRIRPLLRQIERLLRHFSWRIFGIAPKRA